MPAFALTDSRFGRRAVRSGRVIYDLYPQHAFGVLAKWPPGLMLDLGAAQGHFSTMMRSRSPKSRVIAFEPFKGNLPYLKEKLGGDPNIQIVDMAVSDRVGESRFEVASTIQGATPGASNAGRLLKNGELVVKMTTLDAIVAEPVRMMKIDIQGAEYRALKGASKVFRDFGVDLMFVENCGERDAFQEIQRLGFLVFDSIYTIIPKESADLSEWDVVNEKKMTTGARALSAWPKRLIDNPNLYMKWFKRGARKAGYFFTDLVCVHEKVWDRFAAIIGADLEARKPLPLQAKNAT